MIQTRFELDSAVPVADGFTYHMVRGMHLLIIGSRPTWLVLNDAEFKAFTALTQGVTVREVVKQSGEQIARAVLSKIHQARFYRRDPASRRTYRPKLTLYVTNRCNLRCIHCYADAGEVLPLEMSTQEWLEAIEQYSRITHAGEVTISGGEPTLHPDLAVLLTAIKAHGHRSVLFTNGTMDGGRAGWEGLAKLVDVVQLSIDGFDDATNDVIRGSGTFRKTMKTYTSFYSTTVQIRLSVCAMPQNIMSLRNGLLCFLRQWDPQKKIGLILSPTVTAGRNRGGVYAFDYPELQDAIADTLTDIWRSGWRFPNTFQRNDHQPRCGIGSSILISPDGGYKACTFAPISGSFRQESLIDWYERTQRHLEQFNVDNLPMCRDCDLRHVCLGGCVVKMGQRARCTGDGPCTQRNKDFYYTKLVQESVVIFGEL